MNERPPAMNNAGTMKLDRRQEIGASGAPPARQRALRRFWHSSHTGITQNARKKRPHIPAAGKAISSLGAGAGPTVEQMNGLQHC